MQASCRAELTRPQRCSVLQQSTTLFTLAIRSPANLTLSSGGLPAKMRRRGEYAFRCTGPLEVWATSVSWRDSMTGTQVIHIRSKLSRNIGHFCCAARTRQASLEEGRFNVYPWLERRRRQNHPALVLVAALGSSHYFHDDTDIHLPKFISAGFMAALLSAVDLAASAYIRSFSSLE